MGRIIGIDLGTTNSLACFWKDGKSELIPNIFGEYLTPSIVSFDENGGVFVGKTAKERLITHPESTFETFKRSMGTDRKYDKYLPEELSAIVLKSLKSDAERYFGESVEEAVISVPAYFDDKARRATKKAGLLAGLKVDRIINEPSAAALGYLKGFGADGRDESDEEFFDEHSILVFDFGGGTLDVSIVDTFDSVVEIVSVSGDNMLGGVDFDRAIAKHYISEKGLMQDSLSSFQYNCILGAAERAKKELTEESTVNMTVQGLGVAGSIELTNKSLLKLSTDVFKRIYRVIENVMRDSGRGADQITDVILVGGSSKMPVVKYCIENFLHRDDVEVADPDRMIAIGMGVYAGIKERSATVKDVVLTDVCPFSLGTAIVNPENMDGRPITDFIIPRNTALPASRTSHYATIRPKQSKMKFDILQGEELYSDMNKLIGNVEIEFPQRAEKGTEALVTYSYDLNGILMVDIEVPVFGIKKHSVIINRELGFSQSEIDEKLNQLENVKLRSREEEEDRQLIEWGERLFAICPDSIKMELQYRILYYQNLLTGKVDVYKKPRVREYMKKYLMNMEIGLFRYGAELFCNDDSWMDDEDRIIEKMVEDWDDEQ